MSTALHPIDRFTSLFLMYTGLLDCTWNSFQHHKWRRQNTRQTFSQPFSGSFFYYTFSFPVVLSTISVYSFSKLCILPKLCIWGKLGTCGVLRSYNYLFIFVTLKVFVWFCFIRNCSTQAILGHPSASLSVWTPSPVLEVDLGTVRVDDRDLAVVNVLPERIGVPWKVTSQSPVSIFFECKVM